MWVRIPSPSPALSSNWTGTPVLNREIWVRSPVRSPGILLIIFRNMNKEEVKEQFTVIHEEIKKRLKDRHKLDAQELNRLTMILAIIYDKLNQER